MEDLTRLVDDSMSRHGFDVPVDHRRLQWSRWFRCESSFSLLLVPSAAGIYTLGEEIVAPGEIPSTGGKRMLAVFQVSETEDLCVALSRHFAPRSPLSERLSSGRCFVRFAQVADPVSRKAASKALNQWLASSAEGAIGMAKDFVLQSDPVPAPAAKPTRSWVTASDSGPPPLPTGF
jgi:hypothetical protein